MYGIRLHENALSRMGEDRMNNLSRNELIKALVKGLKLDDNIFNYQAVAEEIETVQEKDFMDFYKATMAENTYGNGLQAIMKTAEQFKPQQTDLTEVKAKELIEMCYGINDKVFEDAKMSGRTFDDQMAGTIFKGISDTDIAILNQVKPYTDHKQLFSNMSCYATGLEQLNAFKRAIEYSQSYTGAIECSRVSKMIKFKE